MPNFSLDSLLDCMNVSEVREGVWSASNLDLAYYRIFGGQLLAQAVALGHATSPGKTVKSLHAYFPREGTVNAPLEFVVEAPHDGRSFSTRRISAAQEGKVFFVANVQMHAPDESFENQDPAPSFGKPEDHPERDLGMMPFATRVVDGVELSDRKVGPADFAFWVKVDDRKLPDDQRYHQGLIAHSTDLTIIGTALRPIADLSEADSTQKIHTAVTSHSMWFHRECDINDWCLISQHSPILARGRAFGRGDVYNPSGQMVASFAQESMVRPISEPLKH